MCKGRLVTCLRTQPAGEKRDDCSEMMLEMLRLSLGVTRMDKIRNEYIRGGLDMYGGKMIGILEEG